jgi:hypothetical protein
MSAVFTQLAHSTKIEPLFYEQNIPQFSSKTLIFQGFIWEIRDISIALF